MPALTGAIMCMGVATANSVLVISFARERLAELGDARAAALDAGFVRFRPVLMTALAMIIGMTPMALGLGEGGEQNAPLGRAVIGGLIFATVATLIFVPVVFSMVHKSKAPKPPPHRSAACRLNTARRCRAGSWALFGLLAGIVLVVVVVTGVRSRSKPSAPEGMDRRPVGADRRGHAAGAKTPIPLDLPGRLEAYSRAPIYARVQRLPEGLVRRHRRPVKAGQLLAEIEAPDLDQQLLQAARRLASAQASAGCRKRPCAVADAGRHEPVSAQEIDEKTGDLTVKRRSRRPGQRRSARSAGRLQAGHRAVRRHRHHPQHRRRRADQRRRRPGLALFVISDMRKLRVNVSVPQNYVPAVKLNTKVGSPCRSIPAASRRGRGVGASVDAASGTTRMQLVVDNAPAS